MGYNDFCLNSYLTFRYVAKRERAWKQQVLPPFPEEGKGEQKRVNTADQVYRALKETTKGGENTAIFLSGGIDSAILASFLPKKTKAYTIKFVAENAIDETEMAGVYAEHLGLSHKVISIEWQDYLDHMEYLMEQKKSPLHAIEVALYKAAKVAKEDGIENLIVGNGADSTFGGMDKLLSKDWTFEEFIKRYTFVDPSRVLKNEVSMVPIFERYKRGDGVDVQGFLKVVHGIGIVQSFNTAINAAGCSVVAPYESLFYDEPLDIERIRQGESKYVLRKVFKDLFPHIEVPEKIPFARPMDQWLAGWKGPQRDEFRDDIDLTSFTGDQKWLIFCLEKFLDFFDKQP